MLKNISWDTKDKIKVSLIMIAAVFCKVLFEAFAHGYMSIWHHVVLVLLVAASFAAFLLVNMTEKSFSLFSAQGIIAAVTVFLVLGMVISYRYVSREALIVIMLSSVSLICARKLYLLPITAVIGVVTAFNLIPIEIYDYAALSCVPVAVGASCVCLSEEIKKSAVWKKIVFAAMELIMLVSAVNAFYTRRFTFTFHALGTEMWDSIASFAAIIILLSLTVYAIKNKKHIGEIFGYIAPAAFGAVAMTQDGLHAILSSATMFMMIMTVVKDGSTSETAFENAAKSVAKSVKSKSKKKA